MSSTTVRISEESYELLRKMAKQTRKPMSAVLDAALTEYQRRLFWSRAAAQFRAMRDDPEAWRAEQEEREAWDATLADGTEGE